MCGNDDDEPEGRTWRIWQAIAIVYRSKQNKGERKRKKFPEERTKEPKPQILQGYNRTDKQPRQLG